MVPELNCNQCGWRDADTASGTAVACPRCGAILTSVSTDESTIAWAPPGESPPIMSGIDAETEFIVGEPGASDGGKKTTVEDFVTAVDAAIPQPAVSSGSSVLQAAGEGTLVGSNVPLVVALQEETDTSTEVPSVAPASPAVPGPGLESPPRPVVVPNGAGVTVTISPLKLKLLLSYASAVTLACLYLLYLVWKGAPSLDLPDLAPPVTKANRVTTLLYVSPDKAVPPAHQLVLGESKRFGSLRVKAVKVTRGPMSFSYFNPEVKEFRPDTGPVLKLHLQLENASWDQEFVPLDRQLVYAKEPDKKRFGGFKANNFLCNVAERAALDQHVLVYDLPPDSAWIIQGENLDRELKPGESIEVFVPTTEEGLDVLSGDLVWRVHLRKGYNRSSLRGVTTLVEVRFRSSDIVDERTSPPGRDA